MLKISLVTLIITRRSHMANNDFIISTLNISAQQIRSLSTVKKDQKFYIQVELVPEYPECPFCGGKVKIKDHSRYK